MSANEINRRSFLKLMGWSGAGVVLSGCDLPTTVTLEEGKETVVSYLVPEEYVIPGLGVYYATTCQQCSAACGIHGRVREGRVLKVEGNPESAISNGKVCQMGQAGVQGHYNPDRIRAPLMRKNGTLAEVTWEEALEAIEKKVGPSSGINGERFAWVTGTVSGHQAVLIDSYLSAVGSKNHFIHEVVSNGVSQAVSQNMLGEAQPRYRVDKAKLILSFGSDFLGASASPVHFATQYAKFRSAPRGMLVQVEPKMTLTGANADLWLPARPGTEGVLAMGIANLLVTEQGLDASVLPAEVRDALPTYDVQKVSKITGIAVERIDQIARLLKERAPSLVLVGASTEGHPHGYHAAAAAMLLNIMLGNVGQTIVARGGFPFPQLDSKPGNNSSLLAFAEAAGNKAYDAVFISGANPAYTAPKFLNLDDKLKSIPFKVVFTQFMDETAAKADLVLPLASPMEDWGTYVANYQPEQAAISVQQPLMEKLYPTTRGFGDIVLSLLKARRPQEYSGFADYYAYIKNAFAALPAEHKNGLDDKAFWQQALQKGMVKVTTADQPLMPKVAPITLPEYQQDNAFPYHLAPSARLGLWDGRHANLPWLQEAPDQVSKVVWGSWAEMHPTTAGKLGVKNGEFIKLTSAQGSIEVPVYIYKGIHPDVIAVPMGQGHEEYGRYAKNRGVNPLKILNPVTDATTGELALYGTRVSAARSEYTEPFALVRFGGSEVQVGRKLVATVRADVLNRTEGV